MSDFTFNTTASIRQGWGTAARLGEIANTLPLADGNGAVLFVTDPGIMKLGLAAPAISNLKTCGFDVIVFDQVQADPKASTVLEAVATAKQQGAACVVGFGGGSSMDVAKMIALLANTDQPLDEMYGVNQAKGTRLPLVLVPTTAGTGSEVTAVSILTTGTEEKKGVVSPIILPDIAVLDAELTLGLPPHITAATGVDAMVHAIEAFTSKSPNNNPISQTLAKEALRLLGANIREAVSNGANREAREKMLLGSMLAGQAFANSPVAAVHALAYPVGSLFHVPHGLSNALVLEAVMRFNAPNCGAQYAELAPLVFPDIETGRDTQAVAAEFIERLGRLNTDLGLEAGLQHVGISQSDIPKLASDAMNQTRLLINNPREMHEEDAARIYQASL
ncbi:iron-containing alcohol dehydrogenase [Sulfitobacter sp. G21635-S1]|uniref:iron-containing alcohol dehydrogenase n=1 Tax=Sulfitobacter sp. G21635-S1 TaxID=3014043 RepID=UPI0022AFE809|nr:iron-containing alcohol dehydrogenase [Sulfitobacter sp. G21635-S1]MCZ4255491.1 iron-containing alcohol dehydrogenase [Sulfitobacter sp. G21635-S1]